MAKKNVKFDKIESALDFDLSKMNPEMRTKQIGKLEDLRASVVEALEDQMQSFARLTNNKKLGKRKHNIGKAPNDWKGMTKDGDINL